MRPHRIWRRVSGLICARKTDLMSTARIWFKVDALLPMHPKLAGLRTEDRVHLLGTLVQVWCYAKCTPAGGDDTTGDMGGLIPHPTWLRLGTARGRRLAVERGFVIDKVTEVEVHDWAEHQSNQRFRDMANRRWHPQAYAQAYAAGSARARAEEKRDREDKRTDPSGPVRDPPVVPPAAGRARAARPHPPPSAAICRRCGNQHPSAECPY